MVTSNRMLIIIALSDRLSRVYTTFHSLSLHFMGQKQSKRFDVTEIVSQLGFADGFFRRVKEEPQKPVALGNLAMLWFCLTMLFD